MRLAAVSDLERRRTDLQRRREALNVAPPRVQLKPHTEWVNLPLSSA